MKIKSIKHSIKKDTVYDIETSTHDYILEKGIISHNTMEMYSKPIVSGGTGLYLSAHDIWIVGRQQEKEDKEIVGYTFVINVEKSRLVKEKSKIPITITYENGINAKSGLFDVALEGKFIKEVSKGWYSIGETGTKKRRAEIEEGDFLLDLVEDDSFKQYIRDTYKMVT